MTLASELSDRPAGQIPQLSAEDRAAYDEAGYFVHERLFSEDELKVLRRAVEDVHQRLVRATANFPSERIDNLRRQALLGSLVKWETKDDHNAIRSMEPVYHLSSKIDALIDDPRLTQTAAAILKTPTVSLFTDKLNFKRPGGAPFPWHQDAPYWKFTCDYVERLVSVQLYLDDATEENGCLWVIPRSHQRGHIPFPTDRKGVLNKLMTDVELIKELPLTPLIAPAGSAIFFDGYVVHGSKGNKSNTNRRALILTYQPPNLPLYEPPGGFPGRAGRTVRAPFNQRRGRVGSWMRQLPFVPQILGK